MPFSVTFSYSCYRLNIPHFVRGSKDIEHIIGACLPNTATDVECDQLTNPQTGEGDYWVVAKMPQKDFYKLVEQLELTKRKDLLELWPEAFKRELSPFDDDEFNNLWSVKEAVNENTYFVKRIVEKEISYVAAKYENGQLYFKKSIFRTDD